MSFKIASQKSFKGQEVKLEINIANTSMCEDHSSESNYGIKSLRTLPFPLVLKNKTIHGDLKFVIDSAFQVDESFQCEVSVYLSLFDIESFSVKAELTLTNLETEMQVTMEEETFSKQDRKFGIGLIRSEKYKKLSNDSFCSTSRMQSFMSYDNSISVNHFSIKGSITLWLALDFVEDNEANHNPKLELANFKSLICKDAFDQLDKNFKIVCQGEEFHFSKSLLSMVSEVFAKMIQGSFNKEATSNSVEIVDFSPETIRTFQKFAFENVELKDEEISMELLMFAQKYLMKPLVAQCKEQLFGTITNENVFDIIKTSYFIDDKDIFKKSSEYLKDNSDDLEDTDEWLSFEEAYPKIMNKVWRCMFLDIKAKGKKLNK